MRFEIILVSKKKTKQERKKNEDELTSAGTTTSSKVIPLVSDARCPIFHSWYQKEMMKIHTCNLIGHIINNHLPLFFHLI